MPNLILLFNHQLTKLQEQDAHQSLGVKKIIEPPVPVQKIWSQVPPEAGSLRGYLPPVLAWLEDTGSAGDFVLIQGEFGATWLTVREAFNLNMIPVYSTTRRQAIEEHLPHGQVEIRHLFNHVRFRRYEI